MPDDNPLAARCPNCYEPVAYPGHPTHAIGNGLYSCERPHIPGTDYYDGRDGSIEAEDDDEDRITDQDRYRCAVCGSEDRTEHNDETHAQEARADLNHEGDPAWNGAFDRW